MIAKRPLSRTRWTFERLEAMFKDQEQHKLTDEAVFVKHGGKGSIWQFAELKKRYNRLVLARTDTSELELIDFLTRLIDTLKEKSARIAKLEATIANLAPKPPANQELIDKLLKDQDLRAQLLTALLSKST